MDEEDRPDWTGMVVPGSKLDDMIPIMVEAALRNSEGLGCLQASLLVMWENGGFTEQGMLPTTPEGMKRHADMLATAAERWYRRWEETKDPDDYGTEDIYVS